MIQNIFPHTFSNAFIADSHIQNNDYIFHFKDNNLLLKQSDQGFEIPRRHQLEDIRLKEGIFLFSLNDVRRFLVQDCAPQANKEFIYHEINFFRTIAQKEIAWSSIVAFHLMNWYALNRFCGKCGNATVLKNDERAISCPSCQTTVYPKISPAIIVAILCKDRILLASNANFRTNFYSLVAGYADIGESLEETVAREVKEEVGLDVRNIRYYKSQPWPFSGSMMIGYIAEADDTKPINIDKKEISDAAWFTRDNLPNHPNNLSIAGEIIEKFKNGTLI